MKMRKFLCMLLACAITTTGLMVTADAAAAFDSRTICLEDMACEQMDISALEHWTWNAASRATDSIHQDIPAASIGTVGNPFPLKSGKTITFNCSYSPSPASVDFGVIAPDGKFYSINVKGGSINQPIRVGQSGDYSVAIRNNSSQLVRIVGFIDY